MGDFDPLQAAEGSSDFDDMTDVQEKIIPVDEGLDLVVSHSPAGLHRAASLLLAVSRMKKPLTRFGRELEDAKLCSVIMDSLVDEIVVPSSQNGSAAEMKPIFLRADSVKEVTLCDTLKKSLVHKSHGTNLQAVTLKAEHGERKVNFRMSTYVTPRPPDAECHTVLLSITKTNLLISCSMQTNNVAVLNLENCIDEKDLQTISEDGNKNRFLFYRRTSGISVNTFESVACRDWFISTHDSEDQPVEMCKMDTHKRLTTFKVE